ncbi:MAG: hypothetical protein U0U70_12135 [Chitinophagaceae bacterium]
MKRIFSLILLWLPVSRVLAQPAAEEPAVADTKYIPLEKTILYKLGDNTVPLKLTRYGPGNTSFCINVHDNEQTAVQAARAVLEAKGGTLLRIENNRQRIIRFRFRGNLYAFDPNRIFSRTGIEQSLKENGRVTPAAVAEVEKLGQRILELVPDSINCIIALHNNTEEAYSVNSYLPKGDRHKDAREVHRAEDQDVDDIAFTTDEELYRQMAAAGYNAILQDNTAVKRDGSLSVYCGEHKRRYINIETQHGKTGQYQEMLERLLKILAEENKKSSPHNGEDLQ